MCFVTTKTARAKIAKEDIECWKTLYHKEDRKYSACENYVYVKDIIQPQVKIKKDMGYDEVFINQGYHSCRTIEETKTWVECDPIMIIHKFIIPKGTRYFENEEDYVSETIILID